jgi:hypothetical protein
MNKFEFLKSVRFWKITICAVAVYLQQLGIIDSALTTLIITIAGGSTVVRTVDRFAEKINRYE